MIFDVERLDVMRRFLVVEKRATVVLFIRAIPSMLAWIAGVVWLFN